MNLSTALAQFSILFLACLLGLSEAGTWLSFNQKTGGLEADVIPLPPNAQSGDVMRMLKDCNQIYTKRVARSVPVMTRQERKDFEMCKALLELVERRR